MWKQESCGNIVEQFEVNLYIARVGTPAGMHGCSFLWGSTFLVILSRGSAHMVATTFEEFCYVYAVESSKIA